MYNESIVKFIFVDFMLYQLKQNTETKTYTWHLLDETHQEVIEINTWKGRYVVPNPKPKELPKPRFDNCPFAWSDSKPFWQCSRERFSEACRPGYHIYESRKWYQVQNFDPFTKQWIIHVWYEESSLDKLLNWILAQPPAPDFEGAQEDKTSMEETFREIEQAVSHK